MGDHSALACETVGHHCTSIDHSQAGLSTTYVDPHNVQLLECINHGKTPHVATDSSCAPHANFDYPATSSELGDHSGPASYSLNLLHDDHLHSMHDHRPIPHHTNDSSCAQHLGGGCNDNSSSLSNEGT